MKKELSVFLCAVAALSFCSCSDMDVSQEEKYSLPSDFDWQVYAEINKDVAMSQIIMDIRENNRAYRGEGESAADSTAKAVSNCANLLSDNEFAKKVYLNYAACPKQGWVQGDRCPGGRPIFSNNDGDIASWQCGDCWRGGWDDLSEKDKECLSYDPDVDEWKPWCANTPSTLESILPEELAKFNGANSAFAPLRLMCFFMPKAERLEDAENYLKSYYYSNGNTVVYGSKFDSTLVQLHYYYIGLYDGRPYKYCESGKTGEERSLALADKRAGYYDYGKYTFCLDKSDDGINDRIYVVK